MTSRIIATGPDGYFVARDLESRARSPEPGGPSLTGDTRPNTLQITAATPSAPGVGAAPRFREYADPDERSWLRCRVLGFLDTTYFDDVWPTRPAPAPGLSLVAVSGDDVVAICDASLAEHGATIDTVVVHPDHRRTGLAGALLDELVRRLKARGITRLDAWTRDDPGTRAWYEASGFEVGYRYLHVYVTGVDEMADAVQAQVGLEPRSGFFHADTQDPGVEADLRRRFRRVHACHRFVRDL
ncbi:GNAT family N-acetyltransferase [Nocardioides sp. InS609-2]|uniref:GNAT family N-acetyltransferase n=1 Tax=Nocardioides sp. InS609-2 TaxID=2760705 RepID=UPI0020BF5D20|nr:GNAT family N-acetyltransferase [Nocardioides sp. InS609-2]